MTILSFDVIPSNCLMPLGLEVWLNHKQVSNHDQILDTQTINCEFDDDTDQLHQIKIVVKHKTHEHTQLNDQGEILKDSTLEIKKFEIDCIDIDNIVQKKATYTHSFNGTQSEIVDKFYSVAGCNGIIAFEFTSPVYLWILENM